MGGTTKASGWALFWFLSGFTILGSSAAGTGMIGLLAGLALIVMSFVMFKALRATEEA